MRGMGPATAAPGAEPCLWYKVKGRWVAAGRLGPVGQLTDGDSGEKKTQQPYLGVRFSL